MSRPQLGERVELAGRARELVVDLRQHLLVDVLDRDVDRASRSRRRARSARCACRRRARRRAPTRSPRRADRSRARRPCRTAPRRSGPRGRRRACRPRAPGGRRRARARRPSCASASSSCWTSSSGTTASARGTSSVVQSTISGVGCTSIVALNDHGSLSECRELRSRTRASRRDGAACAPRRSRTSRRCATRPPRPRCGPCRRSRRAPARHLALAEPGDLDRVGEVVRRVLDRVLELVRRDVDREADAVVAELLDLAHAAIQAVAARPPPSAVHAGGGTRTLMLSRAPAPKAGVYFQFHHARAIAV